VPIHQEEDEKYEWKAKYEQLEQFYDREGRIKIKGNHSLTSWLSKQKKLNNSGLLNPLRQEMLSKRGVFNDIRNRNNCERATHRIH
jgi:hypothetical protein